VLGRLAPTRLPERGDRKLSPVFRLGAARWNSPALLPEWLPTAVGGRYARGMKSTIRPGKGYEMTVFGLLTLAGLDVYASLVDDQGIDGVIRVKAADGAIRYFDLQIKGGQYWPSVMCDVTRLPPEWCSHHVL